MRRLDGTVALITGASSGIGAALAAEFARRGADVVLAARREERLEAVAAEVRDLGRRAVTARCDVARDGSVEGAVAAGLAEFARIDWLVANAGFGVAGPLRALELDDFRRQFETNVFGVLRSIIAAREALLESRGAIAIIGSVTGFVALPGSSPYAMSKAAVHALADALRYELRSDGIGVTLVVPGFIESEIRQVDNRGRLRPDARDPVPRWLVMPAPSAARRIVRAVVRRRRVLLLTGHGRLAVWLARHVPGLLSWAIAHSPAGRR